MFAVVQTSGKQYRVALGETITVDSLKVNEGDTVILDQVLLISGSDVKIGAPLLPGAKVTTKVVGHGKGDKVITYKYVHRHRFRRRVGFRAHQTLLEIVSIDG